MLPQTYLGKTRVGHPVLDQEREAVVQDRHSLKLERGGKGGGCQAGEEQKHFDWKQEKLCFRREVGGVKYAGELFLILSPGFLGRRDPSTVLASSLVSTCTGVSMAIKKP